MSKETDEQRAARRKKRLKLIGKEPSEWTAEELAEELTHRYRPTVVPPCRVCGGALSISRAGGDASTIWACSGQEDDPERPGYLRLQDGRKIADEHYERSVWEDTRRGGDELVMELLRRSESPAAVMARARAAISMVVRTVQELVNALPQCAACLREGTARPSTKCVQEGACDEHAPHVPDIHYAVSLRAVQGLVRMVVTSATYAAQGASWEGIARRLALEVRYLESQIEGGEDDARALLGKWEAHCKKVGIAPYAEDPVVQALERVPIETDPAEIAAARQAEEAASGPAYEHAELLPRGLPLPRHGHTAGPLHEVRGREAAHAPRRGALKLATPRAAPRS